MLDDVYKVKDRADVFILGELNVDTLKPHSCWHSTLALFALALFAPAVFALDEFITSPLSLIHISEPTRRS